MVDTCKNLAANLARGQNKVNQVEKVVLVTFLGQSFGVDWLGPG